MYEMGYSVALIGRLQEPPVSRQTMWNALKRRGLIKGPVSRSIRELRGPGDE